MTDKQTSAEPYLCVLTDGYDIDLASARIVSDRHELDDLNEKAKEATAGAWYWHGLPVRVALKGRALLAGLQTLVRRLPAKYPGTALECAAFNEANGLLALFPETRETAAPAKSPTA